MAVKHRTRARNTENSENGAAFGKNAEVTLDKNGLKRSSATTWGSAIKTTCLCCLSVYMLVPALAPLAPFIAKQFLYLCLVKNPLSPDLKYPDRQNVSGARSVQIGTFPPDDSIQLGLWQILPRSLQIENAQEHAEMFDSVLGDGKPVIIYLHGNAGSRAADHRLLLYRLLAEMDFHVVTLDYRGFGDSSGWPNAEGVVDDAHSCYQWVRERSHDAPVYVWGHSMGSGIGSALVQRLCKSGSCPRGLILEAPYNSMHDAMMNHPFTVPWWIVPGYLSLISMAYEQEETMFNTQENLNDVTCPVLIVHAEDDFVVPYKLGKRLYDFSVEHRDKSLPPVTFQSFGSMGYGHRHIVDSPDLPGVIRNFVH